MRRFAAIALILAGCAPPAGPRGAPGGPEAAGAAPSTTSIGTPFEPTAPSAEDCAYVPEFPAPTLELEISTEEDFAFDGAERVIYQGGSALVATRPTGGTEVVSPSAPADPSGMVMRSATELVVAAPDVGALELVDVVTGAATLLASGLDQPNGLAAGWDGLVYVSERVAGRVTWIDPDTGERGAVATGLARPNGLALTAAGDRLYIAAEDGIYAVDRTSPDWVRPRAPVLVHAFDEDTFAGTVAVDQCGFVYTVDYFSGRVLRIDPDAGEALLIADLDAGASFGFGSARFAPGGAWGRQVLYTSNRRVMVGVAVGIPGVPSPVEPAGR